MKHYTQWFFDDPPVNKGVYQRRVGGEITYSYWDGERWYLTTTDTKRAEAHFKRKVVSHFQDLAWRGLCK